MFAASHSPLSLTPEQLDEYLACGWFRMNQTIFTTQFLQFNNIFYNATWLRIDLANYIPGHKQNALLKAIQKFKVQIQPAQVTEAHELLYEQYKTGISFDGYSTLYQLLTGGYNYNIYNTWQVNIYDESKLIACGYFDLGKTSAQGIVSIYHPAYKKYSLGKCLIYSKINYCCQKGLLYFYPGYAVPGYPAFDYKLSIGTQHMQYYNIATKKWVAYKGLHEMYNPLQVMHENLQKLQAAIHARQQQANIFYYLFFDAALNLSLWNTLLDYPIFLLPNSTPTLTTATAIVVYDICTGQYVFNECQPVYTMRNTNDGGLFSSDVLSIHQQLYATCNIDEMAMLIEVYNKQAGFNIA